MAYTVYNTVADLVAASESGRGTGKIWRAGGTLLEEQASGGAVSNAAGVTFDPVPRGGTLSMEDFGLSSGDNIGAAMEAAWDYLRVNDGGTIEIPPGDWVSDNRTFTRSGFVIRIVGHGTTTKIAPSNAVSGTYMWDFLGTNSSVLRMEMHDLVIDGNSSNFNGVRVQPSNYVRFHGVQGRDIVGTAFKFIRNYNSQIDVETYFCGDESASRFALIMTGDTTSGQSFNDCLVSGATEQDELGWLFEGCSGILRSASRLKLHGSQTGGRAYRALQIHRCTDYSFEVDCTLGWRGNGFIHISDSSSGDSITLDTSHANAPSICQGHIDIRVLKNLSARGSTSDTLDLLRIDNAASQSTCAVSGYLEAIASPEGTMDYRYIGLAAPGLAGAVVDLSGVVFTNGDTSKWGDDRTAGGIDTWSVNATSKRFVRS